MREAKKTSRGRGRAPNQRGARGVDSRPGEKPIHRNASEPRTNAKSRGRSRSFEGENIYEAEILDGLKQIAEREILQLLGRDVRFIITNNPSHLTFAYPGSTAKLLRLRTVVAVFKLLYFKLPHPFSIVHGAALDRLLDTIKEVRTKQKFTSFRIGAAGSNSAEFKKIKEILSRESGLPLDEEDGDMPIRFRRSRLDSFGWDVLIRLTLRPLSARAWRKANMPGALNATIAAAMIQYLEPRRTDRFLNVMCGSGTFLVERALLGDVELLVGVDSSKEAIGLSRSNLEGVPQKVKLLCEEIGQLSLPDRSFTTICADLPWGRLIGEKHELPEIYRQTIKQVARVSVTGARFAVLTQESNLFDSELKKLSYLWHKALATRIKQSDYSPTLYILVRSENVFRND